MSIIRVRSALWGDNTWPPEDVSGRWALVEARRKILHGDDAYLRSLARQYGYSHRGRYVNSNLPALISNINAALLTREPATITATTELGQMRAGEIWAQNRMPSRLRGGCVTSSAEGGFIVKVSIDPSTPRGRKVPLIDFVPEDRARLKFANFNELVEATFVEEFEVERGRVLRVFEAHEPGLIRYEAYLGTSHDIGDRIKDLTTLSATAHLDPEVQTGIDDIPARYVANLTDASSPYGISDYTGCIDHILRYNDALRMSDSNARAAVPKTFFDEALGDAEGNWPYDETMIPVNNLRGELAEGNAIQVVDTKVKAEDFLAYTNAAFDAALWAASLSPTLLGRNIEGSSVSGTALRLRNALTEAVVAAKATEYETALSDIMTMAARMDRHTIGTGAEVKPGFEWDDDAPINVELNEGLPSDPVEEAQIITQLAAADAMSQLERIRRANPDKSEQWCEAELERIRDDQREVARDLAASAASSLPSLQRVPEVTEALLAD